MMKRWLKRLTGVPYEDAIDMLFSFILSLGFFILLTLFVVKIIDLILL